MADFKTYDAGGPVGSSVTPKEGVASQGVGIALSGLGDMAQVGISAFKQAEELQAKNAKLEAAAQENKVVGAFTVNQLKVVDAYEQGMSQTEARTRLRAGLAKAIADNPAMSKDIIQAHQDLMATAGLGKVVDEGTKQEQMYNDAAASAFKAGFGEGPQAVASYLKFQRNQTRLQEMQSLVGLRNAQLETQGKITANESARMALEDKVLVREQEQAVAAMADAYHGAVVNTVNDIVAKVESGQMDVKEGIAQLNAQRLTITQTIGSQGRKTGADYLNTATAPMLDTIDFAKKALLGEEPLTALNNRSATNVARQKVILTSDPENARVVAASELLRNIENLQGEAFNNAAVRMLGQATDDGKDTVNPYSKDTQASRGFFKIIQENLKKVKQGKATPEHMQELNTAITDVLSGVDMYSNSVKDLGQIKEIQNFLADPNFADYIRKNGGIPEDAVSGARDAVQSMYDGKVLPLIKTELENASVATGFQSTGKGMLGGEVKTTPALDAVTIRFSGSDVMFEGKGAGKVKAKELNQKLAPVMNKMIRVKAHLEGTTDYKASYEFLFGGMVNGGNNNDTGNP